MIRIGLCLFASLSLLGWRSAHASQDVLFEHRYAPTVCEQNGQPIDPADVHWLPGQKLAHLSLSKSDKVKMLTIMGLTESITLMAGAKRETVLQEEKYEFFKDLLGQYRRVTIPTGEIVTENQLAIADSADHGDWQQERSEFRFRPWFGKDLIQRRSVNVHWEPGEMKLSVKVQETKSTLSLDCSYTSI